MNSNMKAPFKLANARPGLLFLLRDSERMRWALPLSSFLSNSQTWETKGLSRFHFSEEREREITKDAFHRETESFSTSWEKQADVPA